MLNDRMTAQSEASPGPDLGGIRRLELHLPFKPGTVNVYLVPRETGWILVDCGMNMPDALSAYEEAGVRWSDIRQTVLTHVHPDHSGMAACIRRLTGAPVRMHRNEENVLKGLRSPKAWLAWQGDILSRAGVPDAELERIHEASLRLRDYFPDLEADSCIGDGEVLDTDLGPMVAMLTPGHSPGHLCFYFPEKKILLAGDQLLKPRQPHLEWTPEGCALTDFRSSLERIAGLDVDWVLPSHGRPYNGHQARVTAILNHCREMDAQIRNLRSSGIGSPHELAGAFWNRTLPPFEHRTAVFEILAYLQHPN
jgi:glyoxylase-like metal-dependent hydrolase (beta-lactamase superfamily II)